MPSTINRFKYGFRDVGVLAVRHRELLFELVRRELTERYAGQMLGAVWALVHPLMLIGLYIFVFVNVLGTKASIARPDGINYAAYILAGLIPWLSLQDAVSRSCWAVTGNASLVKQVVFPIELLPLKILAAPILNQLIATALMLFYLLGSGQALYPTLGLVPLLMGLQWLGMLGLSFGLASLSVFVRDTKDFVQVFSLMGIYLVPVFYMASWAPPAFATLLAFNPFSHMVWCYQDAIVFGAIDHPMSWALFPVFCVASFVLGFYTFRTLKPIFGDLL